MDRGWRPFAQCSAVARRLRLHALIICRCYPFPSVTARAGARRPGVRSRRRKCRSIMGKRSAPDEGHDSGARRSAGEPGRFLQLFCLPYSGPAPRCSAAGSPACRAGSACYPWNCRGAAFASARPCIPMPPAWSRNWPASCTAPSTALLPTPSSATAWAGCWPSNWPMPCVGAASKGRWRYSSPVYPRPPKTMSAATGAPRPTPNWSPRCATTGVLRRPSSTTRR